MSSLAEPAIARCIERLHQEAAGDPARRAERTQAERDDESLTRMGSLFLAVSREEGRLLYLLARGSGARSIVEFGASFGVSTVYLAAAARDNGGRLVTTEVHPDKCAATRATLAEAGLDDIAQVLEGDARETLEALESEVDFVFLDGWKGLYLPVLDLLLPRLVAGGLVAADNVDFESAQPYVERMRASPEFVSHRIGKLELSCYAP